MIKNWDEASLNEFKRQWKLGLTITEISENFDISPRYVQTVKRKLNLHPRPQTLGSRGLLQRKKS